MAKAKRQKLTEDEKLRRRAARKAEATNAKLVEQAGPLYADQVAPEEFTTAEDEYRKARLSWAQAPRGHEAAYLGRVDWRWDLYVIRRLAKQHMSQKDFAIADRAMDRHGDSMMFWRNLLLGRQRIVLSYWRHVYGCKWNEPSPYYDGPPFITERLVEVGEALVWPPEGWAAPLSKEQLDSLLAIPPYLEYGAEVDPLGLAGQPVGEDYWVNAHAVKATNGD